ncbi:Acetyltransferase (GNAT) family protein [Mycobacteroides salmoniphilum]|uniref:Acetyltransferase (GNAT) family protein n=1 Tax=Mycobacteroides salmoniphilum TaxID=404941 RepID=A0A4R8RVR3_9MYCO|nr:GNAT family N-acetyltransferase [Mycobacteroides salmoniphilum]TDZ78557.1 Acetyltransferase (GNAT) family protein [Mycobacteroides salmoniphilum]
MGHVVTLGDPVDVAALRWRWAQEDGPDCHSSEIPPPEFVSHVASWMGSRTVWTARYQEHAAGMVCLTTHERMPSPNTRAAASWGYLGHLYVRPSARGLGIGEALVQTVFAEAERRRYAKLVLSPSELSTPLYRRCGFTDAHSMMVWRP